MIPKSSRDRRRSSSAISSRSLTAYGLTHLMMMPRSTIVPSAAAAVTSKVATTTAQLHTLICPLATTETQRLIFLLVPTHMAMPVTVLALSKRYRDLPRPKETRTWPTRLASSHHRLSSANRGPTAQRHEWATSVAEATCPPPLLLRRMPTLAFLSVLRRDHPFAEHDEPQCKSLQYLQRTG